MTETDPNVDVSDAIAAGHRGSPEERAQILEELLARLGSDMEGERHQEGPTGR